MTHRAEIAAPITVAGASASITLLCCTRFTRPH